MKKSIIPLLVKKDMHMSRKTIMIFCVMSLVSIGVVSLLSGMVPGWALMNITFTLLMMVVPTFGIFLLIQTNIYEKEKLTQLFIMSLPVTIKEFTLAKLWVNLVVFGSFWLATSLITCLFVFGSGLLPYGAIPFISIVFMAGSVAYLCVLSFSLIFQSLSVTKLLVIFLNAISLGYLLVIAFLEPISRYVYGPVAVWNSTVILILGSQAFVAAFILVMTLHIQNKKRDFI